LKKGGFMTGVELSTKVLRLLEVFEQEERGYYELLNLYNLSISTEEFSEIFTAGTPQLTPTNC